MEFPNLPFQIKPDFIIDISFPKRPYESTDNERGGEDVASMVNIGDKHYKTTATFLWDALTIRQYVEIMEWLNRIKGQSGIFYLNPYYHPFKDEILKAYLKQTGSCFYVLDGTPKIETVQQDLYRLRINVVCYPLFIDFGGSRCFIYTQKELEILNEPKFITTNQYVVKKVYGEVGNKLNITLRSNCPNFEMVIEEEFQNDIIITKYDRGLGFILATVDPDKKLCNFFTTCNAYFLPYGDENFSIPITISIGGSDGVSTGTFTPLDIYLSDGRRMDWDLIFVNNPPDIFSRTVDINLNVEAYLANGLGDYIIVPNTQFTPFTESNPILLGEYGGRSDRGVELSTNVVFNNIVHEWGTPERYILYKYSDTLGWQQENIIQEGECPKQIVMSLNKWYKYAVEVRMPNDDLDIYWSNPVYIQYDQISNLVLPVT